MSEKKSILSIIHLSVKSTILDYSFPSLLIFIILIHCLTYQMNDFFTVNEWGGTNFTLSIYGSIVLESMVLLFYSGYLASKLFAKELEDETIQPLFMIKSGRTVVYIGKVLSTILLMGVVTLLIFCLNYSSLMYYGTISYLTIIWIIKLSLIAFLGSLFLYLSSTVVSIISKTVLTTMLFSSFYTIFTLFNLFMETESINYNLKVKSSLFFFPTVSLKYMDFCITHQGSIDNMLILIPLVGVISMILISYFLIKEVSI